MRIGLNLKPGKGGTKRLLAQYGERLVCVRYRYDEKREKRFKTVELIVEEADWKPKRGAFRAEEVVGVRIGFKETDLQDRVRQAGGKWNRSRQVWEMRYDRAVKLGLKSRIRKIKGI